MKKTKDGVYLKEVEIKYKIRKLQTDKYVDVGNGQPHGSLNSCGVYCLPFA